MTEFDVIIIGAGPAGLTAAITCAENNLRVLIIDEFPHAGGRLLGQLYQEPSGDWWNGIHETEKLIEKTKKLNIIIKLHTSVVNLEKNNDNQWVIFTNQTIYSSKYLLLATGAAEVPSATPGWTLPGVMSVGAAQVMCNVHRVKPGNKAVIIGINILSISIAMELKLAGIEVSAIVMPYAGNHLNKQETPKSIIQTLHSTSKLAPNAFLRLGGGLLKSSFIRDYVLHFFPTNGIKVEGIPILLKKAAMNINGTDSVTGIDLVNINKHGEIIQGSNHSIDCDFVCIAGGLYPLIELAALAGCLFDYVEELGGYVPIHNEKMETTIKNLYVAGNITGIEGAKIAMTQGITAAYSILHSHFGRFNEQLHTSIQAVTQTRNDALIQFHPKITIGKEKVYQQFNTIQNKVGI